MRAHPKSLAKLKAKLKLLTSRSNGMGYERRKQVLHETIRGWVGYFKLADMKSAIEDIDKWLRKTNGFAGVSECVSGRRGSIRKHG